jgi:hypothetical protein
VAFAASVADGPTWFAIGALGWAAAVAVKIPLAWLLDRAFGNRLSAAARATAQGVLSAGAELGVSVGCLRWILDRGTEWTAAAFGAGAGWIEVVVLLGYGIARSRGSIEASMMDWRTRWSFVVERVGAVIGHVGSRGLLWLAIWESPWVAMPAVGCFAAVDGLASYGVLRGWSWLEPRIWNRFYGIVTAVSLIELSLFVLLVAR